MPVGPFVVDFYCEAARLAVELDGASHDGRFAYDERRQRYLEARGVRVLRVHNEELLEDAEAVLLAIAKAAHIDLRSYYGNLFGPAQARNEGTRHPLTPGPSPPGEGGSIRCDNFDPAPTRKKTVIRKNPRRPPPAS